MGLILDTNFMIDMEREARHGRPGMISQFFAAHPGETFAINFIVAGEIACGQSAAIWPDWQQLCRPFPVLPWSMEISWQYGEIFRRLQSVGKLIGTNDLWIAATALVHGMGVVTRNVNEFRRVDGLSVMPY